MLVVKIDREHTRVMAKGSADVLIAEVAQLIGSLYVQMKTADAECAEEFRHILLRLLEDDDSPVWQMDPAVGGIASVVPLGQE